MHVGLVHGAPNGGRWLQWRSFSRCGGRPSEVQQQAVCTAVLLLLLALLMQRPRHAAAAAQRRARRRTHNTAARFPHLQRLYLHRAGRLLRDLIHALHILLILHRLHLSYASTRGPREKRSESGPRESDGGGGERRAVRASLASLPNELIKVYRCFPSSLLVKDRPVRVGRACGAF